MDSCDLCNHPPIRHIPDGSGWTCLVCQLLVREGIQKQVCTKQQSFKLSASEREQAMRAPKDSYPEKIVCASCYYTWQQHHGYLCPSGDDTFVPLLECDLPYLITGEN